ncbi:GNAT family N-acetyltransferase [Microlunatus lacustris]
MVRDATAADAAACAAVYTPYVLSTTATFELEPPDAAEMGRRIAAAQAEHAWLVLERGSGVIAGYAYGGPFKARPAYRWACEVSVYLAPDQRGRGGGRALYAVLLDRLAGRGYRTVAAGMTQPNEASAALHSSLGFTTVGTFRRVGWKLGGWHDVTWVQRDLAAGDDPPVAPR